MHRPQFALAVLLLSSVAALATAQQATLPPRPASIHEPTNAALIHARGWQMQLLAPIEEFAQIYEENVELTPGWKPSERLTSALAKLDTLRTSSLRASQIKDADWGIDWNDGIMALLPHLGKLRQAARVLELNARVELASPGADNHAAGVQSLAAAIRLANHTRNDRILISSLVGGAIANRASVVIITLADQKVLTAADAKVLLDAAAVLDPADPFNTADAFDAEAWMSTVTIFHQGPSAGASAVKAIRNAILTKSDDTEAILAKIARFDESQLKADLARYAAFFADAARIFAARPPGAPEALRDLDARRKKGEFGLTCQVLNPDLKKTFDSDAKNRQAVQDMIARLKSIK